MATKYLFFFLSTPANGPNKLELLQTKLAGFLCIFRNDVLSLFRASTLGENVRPITIFALFFFLPKCS